MGKVDERWSDPEGVTSATLAGVAVVAALVVGGVLVSYPQGVGQVSAQLRSSLADGARGDIEGALGLEPAPPLVPAPPPSDDPADQPSLPLSAASAAAGLGTPGVSLPGDPLAGLTLPTVGPDGVIGLMSPSFTSPTGIFTPGFTPLPTLGPASPQPTTAPPPPTTQPPPPTTQPPPPTTEPPPPPTEEPPPPTEEPPPPTEEPPPPTEEPPPPTEEPPPPTEEPPPPEPTIDPTIEPTIEPTVEPTFPELPPQAPGPVIPPGP